MEREGDGAGAIVQALPSDKSCSAFLYCKTMKCSEAEENGTAVLWCYYPC